MFTEERTGPPDRGSVLVSALVAAVIGALLAIGASLALVSAASDSDAAPVDKPLITYDER